MPALPADNTERWFLDYSVGGKQHTMQCRTLPATSHTVVSAGFDELLAGLSGSLALITIDGLRFALQGSDVSNPADFGGAATYGSVTEVPFLVPQFVAFQGRDALGHKNRLTIFGWKGFEPSDYRINAGEDAAIDLAITNLNLETTIFLSIGGGTTHWKPYANFGFNAHWQRKLRG